AAVRTPKLPRTLPKPLAISDAKKIADTDLRDGEEREPWIIARDAAVLALLYGCGLRISEALGLKRKDFTGKSDSLVVTGKAIRRGWCRCFPRSRRLLPTMSRYVRMKILRTD